MEKVKIGFIGCGGNARGHMRSLSRNNDVTFIAFTDIDLSKAKKCAEEYGGRAYSDYHQMLKNEDLDIVFISLPPFAHSDEVMVAAEHGVNIYIEKPIALDLNLAKEMQRAVEKYGVKSQVGYQLRFSLAAEKAKKLIESGELGKVLLVTGKYWCRFIRRDWWLDISKSGGQVVEQSTHLYDILRWLAGDVERVYSEMDRLFYINEPNMTIEDVSSVVLRFKSGAVGSVTATIAAVPRYWWVKWNIVGSDATLESEEANHLKIYRSSTDPLKIEEYAEIGRDLIFLNERNLIEAVKNDLETRTPISEGVKTLELTLAVMKSAREGKVIYL